jgi:CxxC motif-containing protein (DUF1111 family)
MAVRRFFTARQVWKNLAALCLLATTSIFAQTDPGVRGGTAAAGGPIAGLTTTQLAAFNAAQSTFQEVDSVLGTIPGEAGVGLGPSFNMNSCSGCHAQPAVGGTSPSVNPQVRVATLDGAQNVIPPFITSNGPVREARFKHNADGTADGGVHDLFVITGRTDANGCTIQQTNFGPQLANNNVIFRIPTPVFGTGLIEMISDSTIIANKNANASTKTSFGISGHENRSGNDGSITRFGWKAQNKSLAIFAGEAYNVEQGVTNELFPNPRETQPGCAGAGHPNDNTFGAGNENSPGADVIQFGIFMRLTAPPAPVTSYGNVTSTSIQRGLAAFNQVGCALCHTQSMTTDLSRITALSQKPVNMFSDLLVHNMGSSLADGVSQGNAGPDEFRTAPLWGLGQRIFFLHDGRTSDLLQAILAHDNPGSEAIIATENFEALSAGSRQDLLNFLRSL